MKKHILTIEELLYGAAVALALFVRLVALDKAPLADGEAGWALQALHLARGDSAAQLGPQAIYPLLTAALFALFGATTALARLLPVLAGALLPLLPYLLTRPGSPAALPLARRAGLILAFGLALDPGLTAAARLAGGPMPAVAFTLLAAALWAASAERLSWRVAAGIFAGLALLSGPSFLAGVLSLALAAGLASLLSRFLPEQPEPAPLAGADDFETEPAAGPETPPSHERGAHPVAPERGVRPAAPPALADLAPTGAAAFSLERLQATQALWLPAVAVLLVAGTLFFTVPQGLAAVGASFPAYVGGWLTPSGTPALRLVAALFVYQPLAVVFGIVGLVRGLAFPDPLTAEPDAQHHAYRQQAIVLFLGAWAMAALGLALLSPGRQVTDLVWALPPLWALAALELARHLPEQRLNPVSPVLAGLIFVLLSLTWITLAAVNYLPQDGGAGLARYALMAGLLALVALTTVLVAIGWSWPLARTGLVWGLSASLLAAIVSGLSGVTVVRPNHPIELWAPPPAAGQADLLLASVQELAQWHTGDPRAIDVLLTAPSPALEWLLRDYDLTTATQPAPGALPALVITSQSQQLPELTASYRGQDFTWWLRPGWSGAIPADWIRWLTFRTGPLTQDSVILWARSDLFPGEETTAVQP